LRICTERGGSLTLQASAALAEMLMFGRGQQAAEVSKVRLVSIAVVLANAYLANRKVKPPERATQRANS
jgi:hypothetical protein